MLSIMILNNNNFRPSGLVGIEASGGTQKQGFESEDQRWPKGIPIQ